MVEDNKKQYDKMARLALDVLSDYGFFRFPLDVFALAKKIGMKLIPYSALTSEQYMTLFRKYDMDLGLTVPRLKISYIVYDTYYNDVDMQEPRQRFTIAHEIKHVIAGDCHKKYLTERDDALADFFAKSLLAPQAIIVQEGLSSPEEYEFCFDGIEKNSVVAIGMIGCKHDRVRFMRGYDAMIERISPSTIICFGAPFKEMRGNLLPIDYCASRKVVR